MENSPSPIGEGTREEMDKDVLLRALEYLEDRVSILMAEHTFPNGAGGTYFGHRLQEAPPPQEEHKFIHRINVDRLSLKLNDRVEKLEKRLAQPSKYKY